MTPRRTFALAASFALCLCAAAPAQETPLTDVLESARQRAARLTELTREQLAQGAITVRDACGRFRLAHEVEAAAARVQGDSKLEIAAKRELIQRLESAVRGAEGRVSTGESSVVDVEVARFYLRHAQAHLALLTGDQFTARRRFDEAVRHAQQVAAVARTTGRASRADDLFLAPRAMAERAQHFSQPRRPPLRQLESACDAALASARQFVESGQAPAAALHYPRHLLELTRAEIAALDGRDPRPHFEQAAESAAQLCDADVEADPSQALPAAAMATRLLRDAVVKRAGQARDPSGLIEGLAEVDRRASESLKQAEALQEGGALGAAEQATIQCLASLAELERLVPPKADRQPAQEGDLDNSVRYRLYDRNWYHVRGQTFVHQNNQWEQLWPAPQP